MSHRFSVLLSVWCATAALAAPAAAEPGEPYRIDVPAGWDLLPDQSQRLGEILTAELASTPPVPGLAFTARARNWRGPEAGLVVTTIAATAPAQDAPAAARALLDHMRATPASAALDPGDTKVLSWRDVAAEGTAEGHLAWQHLANGTTTLSRALVYLTAAGQPSIVRADCIIPAVEDAALAAPRAACEAVLASLTLTVPAAERAPLAALPPSAPASAPAVAADPGQPSQGPTRRSPDLPPAPTLRAPALDSQGILAMQPAAPEKRSPSWLYLLGAALLIGGAYLVLRGRRTADEGTGEDAGADDGPAGPDSDDPDDPGEETSKGNGSGADRDDEDPDRT